MDQAIGDSVDEKRIRRFEAAWIAGTPLVVSSCLPPEADPSHLPTLEELVHIELEFAWSQWAEAKRNRSGDGEEPSAPPPLLERYLSQFPVLDNSQRLGRLLQQEYYRRIRAGIRTRFTEYCRRFPSLFENEDEAALFLRRENSLFDVADKISDQATLAPAGSVAENAETLGGVTLDKSLDEDSVREVAGYRIMGELGRGGMGLVYKALDPKLNRLVALKMILAGDHAGAEDYERFQREAKAIAQLQHPHIVQIFEVGEENGLPFFVLEFIRGGSLDRQIDGQPWNPKRAADLVETLALAMQTAHSKGIVHRDLKPANVLMAPGRTPKITDFGLAKQLEESEAQTATGAVVGTPSYMAPEQASIASGTVGPTADVYALGAILYTLLTGRAPFQGETAFDTIMQVIEQEPLPPTHLQPKVPKDLETICLKCLAKAPQRRYETAEALADDLRRFLENRPIVARPIGWMERGLKWARRKPSIALLAILLMLSPVAGWIFIVKQQQIISQQNSLEAFDQLTAGQDRVIVATDQKWRLEAQRASREAEKARASEKEARVNEKKANKRAYFSDMLLVQRDWESDNISHMRDLIARYQGDEELTGFEWMYWNRLGHSERLTLSAGVQVTSVALNADETRVVVGGNDGSLKLWDVQSGREVQPLKGHAKLVSGVCFSPDGRTIASSGHDKTVRVWDAVSGREMMLLGEHSQPVSSVCFSPDGKRIVSGGLDRTVRVWDQASGQSLHTLTGHGAAVECVCISPTGDRIASGGGTRVKVWDSRTGRMLFTFSGHSNPVEDVVFSPNGNRIVSAAYTEAKVWDAQDGKRIHTLRGHSNRVQAVAFSPDGTRIVSGGRDNVIKLWDAQSGRDIRTIKGHTFYIESLSFNFDGTRIVSGSGDKTVKIFDLNTGQESTTLPGHDTATDCVCFSPDGAWVASGGHDNMIRFWDTETVQEVRKLAGHTGYITAVSMAPDGKRIVSGSDDKTIRIWNLETGKEELTLRGHSRRVNSVLFSPSGDMVASGSHDHTIRLWDSRTGKELGVLRGHTLPVYSVSFNPKGDRIVSGGHDTSVKVWDLATRKPVLNLEGHQKRVNCVCFSPDGDRVVSGSSDGSLLIWNAHDGRLSLTLKGHSKPVTCVSFIPKQNRIVSGGHDHSVRVWDAESGQETMSLKGHTNFVTSVGASSDGHRLVSGSTDRTVKIWNARPLARSR